MDWIGLERKGKERKGMVYIKTWNEVNKNEKNKSKY